MITTETWQHRDIIMNGIRIHYVTQGEGPLVVLLQVAVAQLGWPWPVKFALILAVSLVVMFASYHWLVRFSVIGAVLNGRRVRKAAQAGRHRANTLRDSRRAAPRAVPR